MRFVNAVLDDRELQAGLNRINPQFGDFCTRVAGEAWGKPRIDQKTKALITIAVDVVNQDQSGPGSPFGAHVAMAMKQGATREEIEELLLFMCVYAGFNKAAGCFGTLNEILSPAAETRPAAAESAPAASQIPPGGAGPEVQRPVVQRPAATSPRAAGTNGSHPPSPNGASRGKIGILIEEHFDPTEYWMFNGFFPARGYEVEYLSHLWGSSSLRYGSNPENDRIEFHVNVTKEIQDADPAEYRGIVLIGAYAMDRLRYEAHPQKGEPNRSAAVQFLRRAMATPGLKIGTICHSLWLLCAAPELLRERKVTCAHNLIYDVQNAGGDVQFGEEGTADVFVDGNLVTGKHPGFTNKFMETFLEQIEQEVAAASA